SDVCSSDLSSLACRQAGRPRPGGGVIAGILLSDRYDAPRTRRGADDHGNTDRVCRTTTRLFKDDAADRAGGGDPSDGVGYSTGSRASLTGFLALGRLAGRTHRTVLPGTQEFQALRRDAFQFFGGTTFQPHIPMGARRLVPVRGGIDGVDKAPRTHWDMLLE